MNRAGFSIVLLLIGVAGCRTDQKPVELTEQGWIIGCIDHSSADSSGHGLPFVSFSTMPGGHFDVFTFSNGVPACSTWKKRTVQELDFADGSIKDYQITVIQHTDLQGRSDGTWDLVRMRDISMPQY